jgi:hypothetical protein
MVDLPSIFDGSPLFMNKGQFARYLRCASSGVSGDPLDTRHPLGSLLG